MIRLKKVVLFIPSLRSAGAEKFVTDLALNIDKSKFEVIVAVTKYFEETAFLELLRFHDIPVIDLCGNNLMASVLKIERFFRRERPEIIHANLSSILYVIPFCAMYKTNKKFFTFHSVAGRAAANSRIKKRIYQFAFDRLGFVPVAICDYVKASIIQEYHIPEGSIPCIYNGVDTERFTPGQIKNKDGAIRFISTGALYHIKNHKLMIEAFKMAEKIIPEIELTILGEGELREGLEKQIAAYGLANKVHLPGIQKDVSDYLQKSHIFILSSNVEGLPISVLEAMSCGLPVITTAAGGVIDIIKNNENGIVVPIGDAEALHLAMIRLITEDQTRENMGELARTYAKKYDIHRCVEKYVQLYEEVMPL